MNVGVHLDEKVKRHSWGGPDSLMAGVQVHYTARSRELKRGAGYADSVRAGGESAGAVNEKAFSFKMPKK